LWDVEVPLRLRFPFESLDIPLTILVCHKKTGQKVKTIQEHTKSVNKMQLSQDGTMLISASSDHSAKLFDVRSMEVLKTYKTEQPVNSAAISPLQEHVRSACGIRIRKLGS
jgi:WD40 repeat protein